MEEMLLLEIFSGQTKKSLLRCGAVCKRWQSLIKESHVTRSIDHGSIILRDLGDREKTTFYRFDNEGRLVYRRAINPHWESIANVRRYASPRNPVILYCTEPFGGEVRYHVYNPLTLVHLTIVHDLTRDFESRPYHPSCLGYVPCSEDGSHFKLLVSTCHDIGNYRDPGLQFSVFDSETREWKTAPPKLSIFDSDTGQWKTDESSIFDKSTEDSCVLIWGKSPSCIFLDGDIFWLTGSCIMAFRLKTWTVRRIELPPHNGITRLLQRYGYFWESDRRRLKYCEIVHQTPIRSRFCIWVLDEPLVNDGGNKHWRKVFCLSEDALDSVFSQAGFKPYHGHDTSVSSFDEDEGILHLQTPLGLLSYDISEKRTTPIWASSLLKRGRFLGHQPFTCNNIKLNSLGRIGRRTKKRKIIA